MLKFYNSYALSYKSYSPYSYAGNNKISRKQDVQVPANGLFTANAFDITQFKCFKGT